MKESDTKRQETFQIIDHIVMGHAFAIHNELGRFWNEKVYQNELFERCLADERIDTATKETLISTSFISFVKEYYADLIINDLYIYELKATDGLNQKHKAQLLNYLLLTNRSFGKLVNFGGTSVESNFVSTRLTREKRLNYIIDDCSWNGDDQQSKLFKSYLEQLFAELGLFLKNSIYTDAITELLGGESKVIAAKAVSNGRRIIAYQKFHLIDNETAFKVTSLTESLHGFECNLNKMLRYTNLKRIHWVNLNHHKVIFKTIEKNKKLFCP